MRRTSGTPRHVTTKDQARILAQQLVDPQRRFPFVVITTPGRGASSFDAQEIAAYVGIKADVWVVDDRHTWDLNHRLGNAKVFGDAAAVYPPTGGEPPRHRVFDPRQGHSEDDVVRAALDAAPGRTTRRAAITASERVPISATGLHHADTPSKVDALAHHLLNPGRDRPVAVVTIPSNRSTPWIDPQEIIDTVGPSAEVHLIETGPRTFQLTDHLNAMAGVYGGAGRVYDVGQEWIADPYLSPLRFAYNAGEGSRACNDLINDLVGALARTGHLTTQSEAAQQVSGTVTGLVPPSRAFVSLDNGGMATIWAELTAPGVEIGSVVSPDLRVDGQYDPGSRRVDISRMVREPSSVQRSLSPGEVIAASVQQVSASEVVLVPYPGVTATLSATDVTGNELDELTDLLGLGEVVAARYLGPGADAATWVLAMHDLDDDEVVTPVALLDSGPPWLTVVDPRDDDVDALAAAAADEAGDDRQEQDRLTQALRDSEDRLAELSEASALSDSLAKRMAELETLVSSRDLEIDTLHREKRQLYREVERLARQLDHERTKRRQALRKSTKVKAVPHREPMGFTDVTEQLRWDIQRTWVETTRPEEKGDRPLRQDYRIGPDFCQSVQDLEGVGRDRVLQVIVWLLTGRGVADDHPLRTDKSGNSPPVTRMLDGVAWTCRRAPLQQSSPSARRLSYWSGPGGQIELSRVAVHDDLSP